MIKRIILALLFASTVTCAQSNFINGKVVDSQTEEPLIGVNIIINELENVGAASDLDGFFSVNVPLGSYTLTAKMIGFKPVVKTDIVVNEGSEVQLVIRMSETSIQMDQVEVKADYFDRSIKENDLSTVVLSPEEIRRSPGSAQDFQRILQGMAGVSFTDDKNNELLVRGGSPNENLIVFDNIEIHSTNHYPNEQNSGGPINMINVELIENIQFSTGGFISKYGDKLSSVMNIDTRDGTRINNLNANINFSMAGLGAVLEGKMFSGKGSWILSIRKSYLDLVTGAIGLTAVPRYYDGQFKLSYDFSNSHKISWTGIFGNDRINIEGESEKTDRTMANKVDSVGFDDVDVHQQQFATGITLKSLWSKNLLSEVTAYFTSFYTNVDVRESFVERTYNSDGKAVQSAILNSRPIFDDNSMNRQGGIKAQFTWNPTKRYQMEFGGQHLFGGFKQDFYLFGDSARYQINGNWSPTVVVQPAQLEYDLAFFDYFRDYLYLNNRFKLLSDRAALNVGIRYDYFSYSEKGNISPRISASYFLIPEITNINIAYGEFYQTQNYPTYGDREQQDINRYLKNSHSRHVVLGLEHLLDTGLKLTVEGYYKNYDDIPVSEEFIRFDDRTFRSNKNLNVGKKTTYGVDILLQQKLVDRYYGTFSFSRMWSDFGDPRIGREGETYPSDYDFPYVLSVVLGKRFDNLRDELDQMPFYIKYPSYILPFSNDMEISFRWRYASGRPYTPMNFSTNEQYFEGETRWSKGAWVPSNNINSERYPAYHRLDVAFNSRYNLDGWSLGVFLSVMNIYNRDNIAFYQYNSDGTIENVSQFSLFPVAGIEVEF